jgi:hypothetical protein
MRFRLAALVAASIIPLALCVGAVALYSSSFRAPPLLRDLAASGGHWAVCPETAGFFAGQSLEQRTTAECTELTRRLTAQFPPGTPEKTVRVFLITQGFKEFPACKEDSSIRTAVYRGSASLVEMWAQVFWKVDGAGHIEWLKASVAYTFL